MQCYKSFKNEYTKQEMRLRDCSHIYASGFPFLFFLFFLVLELVVVVTVAFCTVEGLVCPVIMKMLLLTSAD